MSERDTARDDFDTFVRRYTPTLRTIIGRMPPSRVGDVDDLLQEALLRAYASRHKLASDRHAVNFICHVVRGLLVDEKRSWYGQHVALSNEIVEDALGAAADPADVVVAAEDRRLAVRAVAALPHAQRQLLWDHAVEGESYADIARRTATPLATVRSIAHRARGLAFREFTRAGGVMSAVPAVIRGWRLRWSSRLQCAPISGEGLAAGVVVISLLFATSPAATASATTAVPLLRHRNATAVRPHHPPSSATGSRPRQVAHRPPASSRATPSAAPTAWQPPPFQDMRFSGPYSSECTFTEKKSSTWLYRVYSYDCSVTASSDRCTAVSDSVRGNCRADLVSGILRGQAEAYDPVGTAPDVGCRAAGGTGETLAESVGVMTYVDAPGATPLRIPVRFTVSHKTVTLSGSVLVGDQYVNVTANLPFTCETIVAKRIGYLGQIRTEERPKPLGDRLPDLG